MIDRWLVLGPIGAVAPVHVTLERLAAGPWMAIDDDGNKYDSSTRSRLYQNLTDARAAADAQNRAAADRVEKRVAAKKANEARIAACSHDWRMKSHEEKHCRLCGAWEFVPDLEEES